MFVTASATLAACSGGGGDSVLAPTPTHTTPTTFPNPNPTPTQPPPTSTTQSSSTNVTVPAAGGSLSLPPTTTVTGSVGFAPFAIGGNVTIALGVSNVDPASAPVLQAVRRHPAARRARPFSIGTSTDPVSGLAYVSLTASTTASFTAEPSFTLTLPAGAATTGRTFYLALYDPTAASAGYEAASEGPATVTTSGGTTTLAFAGQPRPLTLAANATYTFALYSRAATTQTNLYVFDNASQTVVVYPTTANGNVAPTRTLTFVPPASNPNAVASGIAEDAAGELYVIANDSTATTATYPNGIGFVNVYAAGAAGAATPIRTIAGANTTILSSASDSYVDGEGNLWINNAANYVEFAPGANGDVAPMATLDFGSGQVSGGIAVGKDGTLYAATQNPMSGTPASLTIYAPGSTGAAVPSTTYGGTAAAPIGGILTLDGANALYTVTGGNTAVSVYPQGATAPARTIVGAATGIAGAQPVAVDPLTQNLFVGNQNGSSQHAAPILVFAPGANGNAAPIATISGSNVPITTPSEILIGP